jgi:soluble lytic murein transglycosylase-like protein
MLASFALQKPLDQLIESDLSLSESKEKNQTDSQLTPWETVRLDRIEKMLASRAERLAFIEIDAFRPKDHHPSSFLFHLAELAHQAGNHSVSFSILYELIQRGYAPARSARALKMLFPPRLWKEVQKHALEKNLDPILVLSLIKQESAFHHKAHSGAGARGLMQLMPTTAIEIDDTIEKTQLVEIEPNLRAGTAYLARLIKRFQGNTILSLAGYNAGPSAANRWLKSGKKENPTPLEYIESIPYRETREYVGSILRNYYWYAKLLESKTKAPEIESFWKSN